jgi:hypothetical protein
MTDVTATAAEKPVAKPANKPPEKPPAAAEKKAERWIPAHESRFQTSAEFVSPLTSYTPEYGTPAEHLLRPEYWANIKALRARTRIWVEEESGAYVGELYVLKVGQGYAVTMWLPGFPYQISQAALSPQIPDGYSIEFRGHVVKFRVVRLKDGHVLKSGFDIEEEAQAWLREHKRMLAN